MVQMLASRAAGLRLGRIIVALLIPIGAFAFVLAGDALHEQGLTRANQDGRKLMDLTLRIMFDVMGDQEIEIRKPALLQDGAALARSAGVTEEFNALQKDFADTPLDTRAVLQHGAKLVMAIGGGAGMNEAGNREANTMMSLASDTLPRMILSFDDLHRMTRAAKADDTLRLQKMPDVAFTVSTLEFMARQMATTTVQARALSDAPVDFSRLLQTTWWLTFDAAHFRTLTLAPSADSAQTVHALDDAMAESAPKWVASLQSVWLDTNQRLETIAKARQAQLNWWIAKTFAVAAAAIVLGLGMAVRMFRQTLVKLDEVDVARQDAVVARAEAEQSATDLAAVNDGMAKINAEMASNLRALRAAQDQLVKKTRMEQMGQLTATIAHELRNPLGAVRTSAFLLERKTRGKELGIEGQIQRINNGITRCDAIITQLLDFSRSKQIVTASEDFDQWLEHIIAEEAQRLPAAVSIECALGLGGLHVPFDGARLQRAISNLVSNASEALVGAGEGQLRNSSQNPTITIRTLREQEGIRVEVCDNGPGIKPDDMRRIREPLYTTKSFGTGLGLPAVEQILVQHGGSLQIESEYGHGARFIMRLPLIQPVESAA